MSRAWLKWDRINAKAVMQKVEFTPEKLNEQWSFGVSYTAEGGWGHDLRCKLNNTRLFSLLWSFEGFGLQKKQSGGDSWGDPPVPIPNTVVKPLNVESTWLEAAWEDRKLPVWTKTPYHSVWCFCFILIYFYPTKAFSYLLAVSCSSGPFHTRQFSGR